MYPVAHRAALIGTGGLLIRDDKEKVMRHPGAILIACAAFGLVLGMPAAQAADIAVNLGKLSIDIDFGPPPQRYEPLPPPRHGHVWAPGYWQAVGHHHEWVPGRWIEARRDHAWIADRWTPAGKRWRYEAGHWERHGPAHGMHGRYDGNAWPGRNGEHRSRHQ